MAGDASVMHSPHLIELLEQQTEENLAAMEARVKSSTAGMEELLRYLEKDQEDLKAEKERLEESIGEIFQSVNCLHISKENIPCATLQETPLHKVNRLASKFLFKGKETVQINDHLGDFRPTLPVLDKDGKQIHPPSVLQSRLQNSVANAKGWFSQAQTAATEAASAASESAKSVWAQVAERRHSTPQAPPRVSVTSHTGSLSQSDQSEDAAVLIELQIALDDGRTLALQMRAADRACLAAERFLNEHGLEIRLKDALTKKLTQIEDDAECFPIHTEARLSDFVV